MGQGAFGFSFACHAGPGGNNWGELQGETLPATFLFSQENTFLEFVFSSIPTVARLIQMGYNEEKAKEDDYVPN